LQPGKPSNVARFEGIEADALKSFVLSRLIASLPVIFGSVHFHPSLNCGRGIMRILEQVRRRSGPRRIHGYVVEPAKLLAYSYKPTQVGPSEKMPGTKESLIKIKADRRCKSMKMHSLRRKAGGSKPISPLELTYKADQGRSIQTNK